MSHTLSYLWLCVLAVCSSHPSYNGYEKNTDTRCGVSAVKNSLKVVGGKNSTLGAWPWMAALYYHQKKTSTTYWTWFACAGSLISDSWILTAAHCIPTAWGVKLHHVRLGDLDINETVNDGAKPIEVKVKYVIKHPKFTIKPVRNDIALVHLEEPVPFSEFIRPICLHKGEEYATNESIYDKKLPTIAGWGNTTRNERSTTHLLEVSLDTIPLKTCEKFYAKPIQAGEVKLDKLVLCCKTPKKNVCQGDSGGPLMFVGSGSVWSQGGIVSYGYENCGSENPSVYTKVATFIDWIQNVTELTF